MGRFDEFKPTSFPDNRIKKLTENDDSDVIIIGANCTHVFELPFIYKDYVKEASVIYKQGFKVVLDLDVESSKGAIEIEELEESGVSILSVNLTPYHTQLFDGDTLLDTTVQLKIRTLEGEIYYDNLHSIEVIKPTEDSDEQGTFITLDNEMSDTSKNGVQNKVIKSYVDSAISSIDISDLDYATKEYVDSKTVVDQEIDFENMASTNAISNVGVIYGAFWINFLLSQELGLINIDNSKVTGETIAEQVIEILDGDAVNEVVFLEGDGQVHFMSWVDEENGNVIDTTLVTQQELEEELNGFGEFLEGEFNLLLSDVDEKIENATSTLEEKVDNISKIQVSTSSDNTLLDTYSLELDLDNESNTYVPTYTTKVNTQSSTEPVVTKQVLATENYVGEYVKSYVDNLPTNPVIYTIPAGTVFSINYNYLIGYGESSAIIPRKMYKLRQQYGENVVSPLDIICPYGNNSGGDYNQLLVSNERNVFIRIYRDYGSSVYLSIGGTHIASTPLLESEENYDYYLQYFYNNGYLSNISLDHDIEFTPSITLLAVLSFRREASPRYAELTFTEGEQLFIRDVHSFSELFHIRNLVTIAG